MLSPVVLKLQLDLDVHEPLADAGSVVGAKYDKNIARILQIEIVYEDRKKKQVQRKILSNSLWFELASAAYDVEEHHANVRSDHAGNTISGMKFAKTFVSTVRGKDVDFVGARPTTPTSAKTQLEQEHQQHHAT